MKKLFVLIWIALVVTTAICCKKSKQECYVCTWNDREEENGIVKNQILYPIYQICNNQDSVDLLNSYSKTTIYTYPDGHTRSSTYTCNCK